MQTPDQTPKKNAVGWDQEATLAFESLKEAMVNPLVLSQPDLSKPFVIKTNASGPGIGAILI